MKMLLWSLLFKKNYSQKYSLFKLIDLQQKWQVPTSEVRTPVSGDRHVPGGQGS
jgi:hypothetical protein